MKKEIKNFNAKENESKVLTRGTYFFYDFSDIEGRRTHLHYKLRLIEPTTIKKVKTLLRKLGVKFSYGYPASVEYIEIPDPKKVELLEKKLEKLNDEYKELTGKEYDYNPLFKGTFSLG